MQGTTGFIGGGDVYLDRLDSSGASTGFIKLGNATKFELKVDTEDKKLTSNGRDTMGMTLESYTRITGSTLSMSINQMDPDIMAAIFMGDAVKRVGAGGTITAETAVAKLGKFVELLHGDISAVIVKDSTATTTYVLGTDYALNTRLGMVQALAGGAITDGATIKVSYTWAAETGYKITGATQPIIKVALRLDGKNYSNGSAAKVTVWMAQIKPSSAVDFLASDFSELQFEGEMLTPLGKSWPFEVS